jgi:hypothetical protein
VISYAVPGTLPTLKVARCKDPACTGATLVTTVLNVKPSTTSLTVGGDGLPIISYGGFPGALSVVHCSNAFCIPYVRPR